MTIEVAELIQSDFKYFSKISVFEDQAQFIYPIANVLSRFYDGNVKKHVYLAGIKCDREVAGIIIVTDHYETAELKSQKLNLCWIDTFAIDKKYQKQGIGKKLLKHTISVLVGKFDCICLTVNVRNESAKFMYSKCGFYDTGEQYFGGQSGPQHILKYNLSNGFQDRT